MLLRYQLFLTYGIAFLSIWWIAVQHKLDDIVLEWLKASNLHNWTTFYVSPVYITYGILYAPFWAIVILAIYAAGSVVVGVCTFQDCPEAAVELEEQVKEARQVLKKKGVIM